MKQRLVNKKAIVTGAGRGIGKAVALRLAREGADVMCADIHAENARATVAEINLLGRVGPAHSIDLEQISEIQPMVDRAAREFGRIDILVNVAGMALTKPFLDVSEADWDRVLNINLKAVVFCMQSVARQMIDQIPRHVMESGTATCCCGKIVNFSSISGRRGRALQMPYAAGKAGIISVTQSAALALSPYGIHVNAVAPGVIPTPMWEQIDRDRARISGAEPGESLKAFVKRIPLRRAGTVEDVAGAVAFLCSAEADYITGQTLNVDGGFEMS